MSKYIWLFLFLGICFLTGCSQSEVVMTAAAGEAETSQKTADINETGQSVPDRSAQTKMNGADSLETGGTDQQIYVYVCGHVNAPGVYRLSADARVCDALELAGGVTEDGKPEALNQAECMTDGQTLYVPGADEEVEQDAAQETDNLIDINRADKAALMTLPGIGESKADIIIQYREEHGAFSSIEELMEIPGIKEGVFNKIKNNITCK